MKATKVDTYTKTETDASLNLKANSFGPVFTGVVTAVNVVVTQDIALTGNLVANNVGKTITCANLTAQGNLAVSGTSTFTGAITCGDINPLGSGGIKLLKLDGTTAAKIYATGAAQFYSNVIADGNLTVAGHLSYKPYVAFRLNANAIVQNTGQAPTASIAITRPNGVNGLYTFTFPAHPSGTGYLVFVQPYTTATASTYFTCTASTSTSAVFNVWCRKADNAIVDGNLFCYP